MRERQPLAQNPCAVKGRESMASLTCSTAWFRGAVVTINDALPCRTAIVQALQVAGTDHVLALKRNHLHLPAEVITAFADAEWGTFMPEAQDRCQTVERTERGTCMVPASAHEWSNLPGGVACAA